MEKEAPASDIRVLVRVRPPNEREQASGAPTSLSVNVALKNVTIGSKPNEQTFTYDHVCMDCTQEEIFQKVGKPITDTCLAGYNGTIFAYGQTGSGKTHTIQGKDTKSESRGLMPRVFEYLCNQIGREERKSGGQVKYVLKGSFLEIYNDAIYDLLDPHASSLNVREDIKKGVYVEGLKEESISCAKDAADLMEKGITNRRVGETAMNRESSRSHCVFSLNINCKVTKDGVTTGRYSKFHLIDLAGSERQKMTAATGTRLQEATRINRSLSALSNVIMSLVEVSRSGKERHIHYRDSKLTYILKDSLGGNSLTYIVGCVSPSGDCFGETLSTLKFAQRAKFIKNNVKLNEDDNGSLVGLKAENEKLKAKLAELEAMGVIGGRTSNSGLKLGGSRTPITPMSARSSRLPVPEFPEAKEDSKELETLLEQSLAREQGWKQEIEKLGAKIQNLEQLIDKLQKQHQSNSMIIRFRDKTIQQYKERLDGAKGKSKLVSPTSGEKELILQQEIQRLESDKKELSYQLLHHPQVLEKNVVINDLNAKITELEIQLKSKGEQQSTTASFTLAFDLIALRKENQNLKNQVAEYEEKMKSPGKLLEQMKTPEKRKFESFELEKWKIEQNFNRKTAFLEETIKKLESQKMELESEFKEERTEKKKFELCVQQLEQDLQQQRAAMETAQFKHELEKKRQMSEYETEAETTRAAYQRQFEELERGVEENKTESKTALAEVGQLKAQLEIANVEKEKHLDKIKESEELVNSLEEKLQIKERQFTQQQQILEHEKLELSRIHEEVKDQLERTEKELRDIKTRLSVVSRDYEESATVVEDLQEKQRTYEGLLQQAGEKEEKSSGYIIKLENEVELRVRQFEKAKSALDLLQEEHSTLTQEHKYLGTRMEVMKENITKLEFQLQQKNKALELMQRERDDQIEASAQLEADLLEMRKDASLDYTRLAQQKERADGQVKKLKSELIAMTHTLRESKEQYELKVLESLNFQKQLKEELESLEVLKSAFKELRKKHRDVDSDLKVANEEIQILETKEHKYQQHIQQHVKRAEELAAHVNQVKKEKLDQEAVFRREVKALIDELKKNAALFAQVDKIRKVQEQELGTLKTHIMEMSSKAAAAREKQGDQYKEKLKELEEANGQLKKECSRAEVESKERHQRLQQTLEKTMEIKDGVLRAHMQAVKEIRSLQSRLGASQGENKLLQQRLFAINNLLNEVIASQGGSASPNQDITVGHLRDKIKAIEYRYVAACRQWEEEKALHEKNAMMGREQINHMQRIMQSLKEEHALALQKVTEGLRDTENLLKDSQLALQKSTSENQEYRDNVSRLESLLEKWQSISQQQSEEINELRERNAILEGDQVEIDRTNHRLQQEIKSLQEEITHKVTAFEAIRKELNHKLALTQELAESLTKQVNEQSQEIKDLVYKNEGIMDQLDRTSRCKQEFAEEVQRYRAEEEKSFAESLRLKAEGEKFKEELGKLRLELEKSKLDVNRLGAENLRLIGHQNVKQKIQHHMKIKKENDALRQEKLALEKEVKKLRGLPRSSKKQSVGQENVPPLQPNLPVTEKEDEIVLKGKITDRSEKKDPDYFHQLVDVISHLDSDTSTQILNRQHEFPYNERSDNFTSSPDSPASFGSPMSPDPEIQSTGRTTSSKFGLRTRTSDEGNKQLLYQKSLQHLQGVIDQLKSERRPMPFEPLTHRTQQQLDMRRKNTSLEKTLFG